MEKNLQELLEAFPPPLQQLKERETPSAEYLAKKKKLQEALNRLVADLSASRSFISTIELKQFPSHLNLFELFGSFPNLNTLRLTYGAKAVGMEYDPSMFGMKLYDVASLSQLLQTTHNLTTIHLTESCLDDESVQVLTSGLSKNETVTSLGMKIILSFWYTDLSHNRISDAGARRIANLIENNQILASLSLADNQIHAKGAKFFGQALGMNKTITYFDIKMNSLSDEGGKLILEGLLTNASLRTINLSSNQLGSESGIALQKLIEINSTLIDVDISCNHIASEADDKKLKEVVLANTSLLRLDLRKNDVLNETIDELGKALRKRELQLQKDLRERFHFVS